MNFKHYPQVDYKNVTPATLDSVSRHIHIKKLMIDRKNDLNKYKILKNPLLEAFKFERIIIDEGHEIFGGLVNSNKSLSKYLLKTL